MPELKNAMFYHYRSHSLLNLAENLSQALAKGTSNPLEAPWVIVQNNEIKEWLSLYYAEKNGIAANFKFIFPSEFLWTLYRLRFKDIPPSLPGDLNAMHWTLFQLFSEQPKKLKIIPSVSVEIEDSRKLFQFCGQLANVFDQYQVYRPAMMELWLNGKISSDRKDEKWQAEVWKELNRTWASSPETKNLPRRSEAFTELLNLVEADDEFVSKLPNEIFVFGLSQYSNPFLNIITSLSAKSDVHLFSRSGNRKLIKDEAKDLFEAWNKPQQEQMDLLYQLVQEKQVSYCQVGEVDEPESEMPIKFHSCHSKRREVEVLKNEILRFLDAQAECSTSDMLILVPDAEAYGSTLDTVFGNDNGEPALPITRLLNRSSQSAAHALLMLFDLLATSFKASEVMQVLNLAPIREKFEFTESDVDIIEEWVIENRIFQGLGADFNTAYSWTKGLNQLFAGFTMEADTVEIYEGMVPFNGISSSDHIELAAKFAMFINALKDAAYTVNIQKKPLDWIKFSTELVHDFIMEDSKTSSQKSQLYTLFAKLEGQVGFAKADQTVSYELIKPWLLAQIDDDSTNSGRFGHGITVSTYIPYRSVPFRFIGMLGLNESVFPRKLVKPSFDLINSNPRPGDRVLKEDDTFLFLETINAAQDHLHLSYEGQDEKTDNLKLPSILIQQLAEVYFDDPEAGMKPHALHSFHEKYFMKGDWESYSEADAKFAHQMASSGKKIKPFIGSGSLKIVNEEPDFVEFSELVLYFSHPCKWFVQKALDIKNYNEINELRDREIFKLESLDKYGLNDLLQGLLQDLPVQNIQEYVSAAAFIPEGLAGEKAFQNEKALIDELLAVVAEHAIEQERKIDVAVEINGITISGKIEGVCGKKLISYRVGNLKAKYLIDHWLKHLLLIKSGIKIEQSIFVYKEKDKVKTVSIESNKIAGDPLNDYLNWYLSEAEILERLTFFPESSRAFAEKILKGSDESDAYKTAFKEWEDSWAFKPESEDYFNALIWRGREPLETKTFQKNAILFWKPFFNTQSFGGK